jgi:hypothetical protein
MFELVATTLTPQAPTFLGLGLLAVNQPLGSGCNLHIGSVAGVRLANANSAGEVSFAFPIPNGTVLRGVEFTTQAAVLDPSRSVYLGLTLSEGLRVRIGD